MCYRIVLIYNCTSGVSGDSTKYNGYGIAYKDKYIGGMYIYYHNPFNSGTMKCLII